MEKKYELFEILSVIVWVLGALFIILFVIPHMYIQMIGVDLR